MYYNDDISTRMQFNHVSESYLNARPEYPQEAYNDIRKILNGTVPHALEIGSGSGQATTHMQTVAQHIDCVEPGNNFCQQLHTRFATNTNIQIHHCFFEAFEATKKYDCIFSASALHWVPKHIAIEKCAALLKPQGWFVGLWHMPRFTEKTYQILEQHIHSIDEDFDIPRGTQAQIDYFDEGLAFTQSTGAFGNAFKRIYYQEHTLSSERLTDLIWSYVNIEKTPPTLKKVVRNALAEIGLQHKVTHCFPVAAVQRLA